MSLVGYLLNLLTQKVTAYTSRRMRECEMHPPPPLFGVHHTATAGTLLFYKVCPHTLLGQSDVKKVSPLPVSLWREINPSIPTMSPNHTFLFVLVPKESSAKRHPLTALCYPNRSSDSGS